jgi:hypothetical protein
MRNYKMVLMCVAVLVPFGSGVSRGAYPADPGNAALLYYQAFLLVERPDEATDRILLDVSKGTVAPNEATREYLKRCREAVHYAAAASEIQRCEWGLKYSDGFGMQLPHLAQLRNLTRVLLADARVLAAEGRYREALDRCLVARKMGRHVGDETIISFLVGVSIDALADGCIQDILGRVAPDAETLKWLKEQLTALAGRPPSVAATLRTEREVGMASISREGLSVLFQQLDLRPDKALVERVQHVDEATLEWNRNYYANHVAAVHTLLSSPVPYEQKFNQLRQLDEKPAQDAKDNPDAALVSLIAPATAKVYNHEVTDATRNNALRVALELYLIRAEQGALPAVLPPALPKDLFSGEDFLYEKTDTGFVLRCQGQDLLKNTTHEFAFTVK